jgi:hypothetical protein
MEKSRQFPQIHILNGHCDHKAFCVVKNVFCIYKLTFTAEQGSLISEEFKNLAIWLSALI